MSFNIVSYVMGKNKGYLEGYESGEKNIVLTSDDYTFSDDGNGNVTIERTGDA